MSTESGMGPSAPDEEPRGEASGSTATPTDGPGPGIPPPPGYSPQQLPYPGDGGRRPRRTGMLAAAVVATALVAGGIGGGVGVLSAKDDQSSGSTTVSAPADQASVNRSPQSVSGIAKAALPSVVTIKAQGSQGKGTGTGFVYDKQGHILTNNHVVEPASGGGKLTVTFSDGKSYEAKTVGRAQGYDVAVVKLEKPDSHKLEPLTLGSSEKAAVGDNSVAIGAPYGLSGTVTTGIISAKHRPVQASGDGASGQESYMNAIQTDASINPGNSGGPLLDSHGNVIGITSAIRGADSGGDSPFPGGKTKQSGSIGLGFAIPIDQAKRVAKTLIETGKPVYPMLGVLRNDEYRGKGAEISPQDIQGVHAVTPDGPADEAGLKPGDVITKLGGRPIDSGPTLVSEIWTHKPGEKVKVEYTRGGDSHTTTVTLGKKVGDRTG